MAVTPAERQLVQRAFFEYKNAKFPGVVGVVDGTHVRIQRPVLHEEASLVTVAENGPLIVLFRLSIWCTSVNLSSSDHLSDRWRWDITRPTSTHKHTVLSKNDSEATQRKVLRTVRGNSKAIAQGGPWH